MSYKYSKAQPTKSRLSDTPTFNLLDDLKHNKFVLIPFNDTPEYRAKFKSLRWDANRKLWYTNTKSDWDKMPEVHIKYYDVAFEHKDFVKEAGFRWDNLNKYWYGCNAMIPKLHEDTEFELIENPVNRFKLNQQLGVVQPEP